MEALASLFGLSTKWHASPAASQLPETHPAGRTKTALDSPTTSIASITNVVSNGADSPTTSPSEGLREVNKYHKKARPFARKSKVDETVDTDDDSEIPSQSCVDLGLEYGECCSGCGYFLLDKSVCGVATRNKKQSECSAMYRCIRKHHVADEDGQASSANESTEKGREASNNRKSKRSRDAIDYDEINTPKKQRRNSAVWPSQESSAKRARRRTRRLDPEWKEPRKRRSSHSLTPNSFNAVGSRRRYSSYRSTDQSPLPPSFSPSPTMMTQPSPQPRIPPGRLSISAKKELLELREVVARQKKELARLAQLEEVVEVQQKELKERRDKQYQLDLADLWKQTSKSEDKLFFIQRQDDSDSPKEWHLVQVDDSETKPGRAKKFGEYHVQWYVRNTHDAKQRPICRCRHWPLLQELVGNGAEFGSALIVQPRSVNSILEKRENMAWYQDTVNLCKVRLCGPFNFERIDNEPNRIGTEQWNKLIHEATAEGIDTSNVYKVVPYAK